ncbi:tRNA1(Val) (adenine(37)-N6)-methyltransferase [Pelagibacterium limicola]|uniref:tRNA1(Val) (adenine(37)-N6)-methyltransferase n=1 Tax=Pelagibacterium limicola TaxID=2791022 RepID=UPI0018AFE0FF|nr:methyltransferase [Pelagibacterium limicola]
MDSVLLGTSVPSGTRRLLDLGAGAGVAGLCAMAHEEALETTFVEIDPDMAELARLNVAQNGFGHRAGVVTLDVLAAGAERKTAGLATDRFDVVIANPPYFSEGTLAPDPTRAGARHMAATFLDGWVKTAVSSAHAQGTVIFIHTADALPELLGAFSARMGGIVVLPLSPRPGMAASRVMVKGRKGSRAPTTLLPPITLHGDEGNGFVPEIDAVLRGTARFDWQRGSPVLISGGIPSEPTAKQ